MPITFENSNDNLMINKYLGPFAVTYLRYQVVDFSSYFYMDASPFMTSFETQVDIYALIRPFNYDIWVILLFLPPFYWIVMGLADKVFNGMAHWFFLLDFVYRNLLKQVDKVPVLWKYITILSQIWIFGAFIMTTLYMGKFYGKL